MEKAIIERDSVKLKSDPDRLSVLIVEDEYPARALLVEAISHRSDLRVQDIVRTGREALRKGKRFNYDLIFMDIRLPDSSGIDVAERLQKDVPIIFITAYDQFALNAFTVGAIDYLLKPFSVIRFNQAVDRVLIKRSGMDGNAVVRRLGLSVREEHIYHFLPFASITYINSSGKHSIIHTRFRDFDTPRLLHVLEKKLPVRGFLRVHKQYIVNINYIGTLRSLNKGDYMLYLKDEDDSQIPVSRNFAGPLKEVLGLES